MKTLLIVGDLQVPQPLREIIERGSTAVETRRAADTRAASLPSVDRLVFWASRGDEVVRTLAKKMRRDSADRGETILFITPDDEPAPDGLLPDECYVWPRDEDRLVMAFMTGA